MKEKLAFGILIGLFLVSGVLAVSDIAVFQGQYFEGTEFQEGTYSFTFDIYDDETAGASCFSDTQSLTTGFWGQWRTELTGISAGCNDTTKDYFVEITIDSVVQTPRRRLTHFNYLRKNVDDSTTGDLTISSILNFLLGGSLQELATSFIFSKSLEITGNLDVNGDATIVGNANITGITYVDELIGNELTANELNVGELGVSDLTVDELTVSTEANINELKVSGQAVCLEDGTDCPAGGGTSYVSFVSTVDGDLSINDRYLPLGTDSLIALTEEESSWIIDRDMTITGILWDSVSNTRSTTSAITLMGGINKNSLANTNVMKVKAIRLARGKVAFEPLSLIITLV